jgi:hypothetical protein
MQQLQCVHRVGTHLFQKGQILVSTTLVGIKARDFDHDQLWENCNKLTQIVSRWHTFFPLATMSTL